MAAAETNPIIRLALEDDATAMLEIYSPFVTDSWTSFEIIAPDSSDFERRILQVMQTHPWLVAEISGEIIGYAYANPHRSRWAYQWTSEVSVYVRSDSHRTGTGRLLYQALFSILKSQNVYSVLAGITLPNEVSVAFHRSLGFRDVGTYTNIGYKMGNWRDVLWLEKPLRPYDSEPLKFIPFTELDFSLITEFLETKNG